MLTKEQTKRLAQEARKLAMECVDGRAPEFGRFMEFNIDGSPCCAIGHVGERAGFALGDDGYNPVNSAISPIDSELHNAWFLVGTTNDGDDAERAALPWALLAFADALEESALK